MKIRPLIGHRIRIRGRLHVNQPQDNLFLSGFKGYIKDRSEKRQLIRIIAFNYSLSPGVWQSFVTIRSCNHLMRIISTMSTTQRKVRSREDDNYSNWVIINYGVYKGLYHISCLLQIIKPFIRPPQGLLFLVVKTF